MRRVLVSDRRNICVLCEMLGLFEGLLIKLVRRVCKCGDMRAFFDFLGVEVVEDIGRLPCSEPTVSSAGLESAKGNRAISSFNNVITIKRLFGRLKHNTDNYSRYYLTINNAENRHFPLSRYMSSCNTIDNEKLTQKPNSIRSCKHPIILTNLRSLRTSKVIRAITATYFNAHRSSSVVTATFTSSGRSSRSRVLCTACTRLSFKASSQI
jgi:hypothetical protein